MNNKIRESNYELLRIIAMLFIIIWHIFTNGNIINNTTGILNFLIDAIGFLIFIHCNLFMLITGYFQSKSKFKLKKLISLLLQIWFYNIFINNILYLSGLVKYSNIEYLCNMTFYNILSYWYIQCYIIVYLLSPFLNKLIDYCSRRELKKLIIVLLCCFSIFPFITTNLFYKTSGFDVAQYILMYFIGAYIRKYNLNETLLIKFNLTQKRAIYLFFYLFFYLVNFMMNYFFKYIGTFNSNILKFISESVIIYKEYYSNPILIAQAVSLFLLFGTFHFKSRIINRIGSLTLATYIIHESYYIRINMYRWLNLDTGKMIYSKTIIPRILITSIGIFIICIAIEFIRQKIFYYISKIGFVKRIEQELNNLIKNLIEIH